VPKPADTKSITGSNRTSPLSQIAHYGAIALELTGPQRCFVPIPQLVAEINRWLMSWSRHYRHGYPREVFRKLDWYVVTRLSHHLQRRSQRPFRTAEGETLYAKLQSLGLRLLGVSHDGFPVHASKRDSSVKPDAGNPLVSR
jgi:Group II intron, maturase-specific domain